tara:strand:- start:157 stop:639 length:483 start_codon:yes stop_codon:yes gene_type:complete
MNLRLIPKVKPLLLSFFFAFLSVITGLKLLSYEKDNIILAHCRKLNLQQIFSYNNIDNVPYDERLKVLNLIKPKKYCQKYLSKDILDQIKLLEEYPLQQYDILYEVVGYKIRLYADSYNRLENHRSDLQSKLLISLLAFNVASLATQSIFLQADSKEIED